MTQKARVITNFGASVALLLPTGAVVNASVRRKLGLVVCGDYVEYLEEDQSVVVTSLQNRQTVLARPDRRGALKPLCSNIEQLLVVCSHLPAYDLALIDAYILYAELNALEAVLIFNKSDLKPSGSEFLRICKYYQQLGYQVLETSTQTGAGMSALGFLLEGKTSMLVGQSGVGKSSLINALLPDKAVQVGALSALGTLGSHTTTTTILYQLPTGGELVDSPGVREFASHQFSEQEVRHGFVEFGSDYLQKHGFGSCKFHNCQHIHEPQCAVLLALAAGNIAKWRYENYQKILQDIKNHQPY